MLRWVAIVDGVILTVKEAFPDCFWTVCFFWESSHEVKWLRVWIQHLPDSGISGPWLKAEARGPWVTACASPGTTAALSRLVCWVSLCLTFTRAWKWPWESMAPEGGHWAGQHLRRRKICWRWTRSWGLPSNTKGRISCSHGLQINPLMGLAFEVRMVVLRDYSSSKLNSLLSQSSKPFWTLRRSDAMRVREFWVQKLHYLTASWQRLSDLATPLCWHRTLLWWWW